MSITLSIVIVNWNTREYLQNCLASIAQFPPAVPYEVIVIDNGSQDGSVDMVCQHFPDTIVIANEDNRGFATANNQGITHSRGAYVLLLNSDTVVHEQALSNLVAFMETTPKAGAIGGRLFNADGSLQPSCRPMLTPGREFWRLIFLDKLWPLATYPVHKWDTHTPRQIEVIKGACLMFRRDVLNQIGVLDERYFMYTEEVDICYRVAEAGWQLWYVPSAVVTHFGEASSKQIADKMYLQLYRSKIQFYRKMGGPGRGRLFKFLVALAYLPRILLQPHIPVYRRLLHQLPSM